MKISETMANINELQRISTQLRRDIVRMVTSAKSGHPGGSLSAADIYTYLYFEEMNIDPADPKKADRDRFVLSKGHASPLLYATLAEKGFIPEEEIIFFGHPYIRMALHI